MTAYSTFFKSLLIALLCWATGSTAIAQTTSADTILQLVNQVNGNYKNDTAIYSKVDYYVTYRYLDTSELEHLEQELRRSMSRSHTDYAFALLWRAYSHSLEQTDPHLIDKGKELIDELKYDTATYRRYACQEVLGFIRVPFRSTNRINEGIEYNLQLANEFEQRGDSIEASLCYNNLRSFFTTLGLLDRAVYYHHKSLQFLRPDRIAPSNYLYAYPIFSGALAYINRMAVIGFAYIEAEQSDKAMPLLREAEKVYLRFRDSLVIVDGPYIYLQMLRAQLQLNLDSAALLLPVMQEKANSDFYYNLALDQEKGRYLLYRQQYDSAKFYLTRAMEKRDEYAIGPNTFVGNHIPGYYLAQLSMAQKKYPEAIAYLNTELKVLKQSNLRYILQKEWRLLADAYNRNGEYAKSVAVFELYDSLGKEMRASEEMSRSMTYEMEQSIAQREKDMKTLSTENEFNRRTKNYIMGIALMIGLVAVAFYLRYRAKKKANLELEEKNEQIHSEKIRSDQLLYNILPEEVAEELKANGSAAARQFEEVTVMFTDFKEFTKISEKMDARELVAEIDYCFKAFDSIIEKYGIEKIKTIGDSYMCAGGLPVKNTTHAYDAVCAALEIQQFMNQHAAAAQRTNRPAFEIRIGIHTGPVVAGIVGIKKFAYDIWGDTVNTASRMESSGEAGKVNISGSTYELVKDRFRCTYRGKIAAKHKGEVDMYFVEGNR